MLLIGIDDAGRGPVIGPMIMAGVLIDKDAEKKLKEIGAKDSKLLTHPQRIRLAEQLRAEITAEHIVLATPAEIDAAVLGTENLNTLEARKMAEIINVLNKGKEKTRVVVDCPSINTQTWREKLLTFIKNTSNLDVVCEHKADANHPVVSAASILAKVKREDEVAALKEQYGEIGSGYPADPITQQFLKTRGKYLVDAGIFRKSWSTWQTLFPGDSESKKGQKTLF